MNEWQAAWVGMHMDEWVWVNEWVCDRLSVHICLHEWLNECELFYLILNNNFPPHASTCPDARTDHRTPPPREEPQEPLQLLGRGRVCWLLAPKVIITGEATDPACDGLLQTPGSRHPALHDSLATGMSWKSRGVGLGGVGLGGVGLGGCWSRGGWSRGGWSRGVGLGGVGPGGLVLGGLALGGVGLGGVV